METVKLGRTGMNVGKIGFGALPIQRTGMEESVRILQRALDAGINFYDTANAYTDSEEKLARAFQSNRNRIFLASKVSFAQTAEDVTRLIDTSLRQLKTDYLDLMQFHNPAFVPLPGGQDGMYDAMEAARQQGKIRFIGLTNHKFKLAKEALLSGVYDTIQYPVSYLSTTEELELLELGAQHNIGLLAMKALCGGLLNNAAAVYHFFEQHVGKVLPIYGIQHMSELEEFLSFLTNPLDAAAAMQTIENDRRELQGEFCRGCGYCLPCPQNIHLEIVCRMSLLLRRARPQDYLTPEWYEKMQQTKECIECGSCNPRCPYDFKPQSHLKENYEDFMIQYKNMQNEN